MSLRSHNGVLLCKDGHLCTTCCTPNDLSLRIWYEWVEPNHDLDTGTRFLGQTVGWSYVPPGGIARYVPPNFTMNQLVTCWPSQSIFVN